MIRTLVRRTLVTGFVIAPWLGAAEPAVAARRAPPPKLDGATINGAQPGAQAGHGIDPLAIRTAILLDRAGFSPGVVDGRWGDNLRKAVGAYQAAQSLPTTGQLDAETWAKLSADAAPVLTEHAIDESETKGPFLKSLPSRLEAMRGLKALAYSGPRELLAERFHMSEALLATLNPGTDFDRTGAKILVADVAHPPRDDKAARIEVDKRGLRVTAYGADDKLLASYPASVGSTEKPAPSGRLEVRSVAQNPTYTYNPDYAFRGVRTKEKFDIAPGPNNPVGAVWIALSQEGYGIHGTPDPDRIGKSYSHGCVRLTNWDAQALSHMVKRGVPVDFKD